VAGRVNVVAKLLDLAGIERERVQLRRVSAAEGALFAHYVKEISDVISELGPFQKEQYNLQTAAIKRALSTRRLRWLSGMEYHLDKHENVYGEKTNPELVEEIIDESIASEYYKALILEMLKEGPLSVREMAEKSGLKPYLVSTRLNELEREGQAEFHSHVGTTAKFVSLAA
jgi:predicted Rossmann fold nucleotide-binding protein DprA/Smf involved in DNA uptake